MKAVDLPTGSDFLQRPRDRELELVEVLEWLLEIVGGASLHRLHRTLDLAEAGDDDDRGLGVPSPEGSEHLDAIHVREAEVEEDQVRAHLVGSLEPLLTCADPVDFYLVPG